jgi:hypothetical protein
MVKLETYRRKRRATDYRKCALAAAVLSALIVVGVELTGGPVNPANAGLGAPAQAAAGETTATSPASAPR